MLSGLSEVKKQVRELEAFIIVQQERKKRNLKTEPLTLHMVFAGNPGTGKTTVARLIAKLYHELGLIKTDKLVETDRQNLVGKAVGWTAPKTQKVINSAIDGVLFIDEAYSLLGDTFGQEAIATLLKNMEDHRDKLVVIMAGYPKEIDELIASNPGLKSRFSRRIVFEDYNEDELYQIFCSLCRNNDYDLDESAHQAVREAAARLVMEKGADFANAREVRNLFDRVRTRQTLRLRDMKEAEEADFRILTAEDFS